MEITDYLYNTFLVEDGDLKIAIHPGALFLYCFRLTTLILKSEWPDITHIFVTHGNPDHYWHTDSVAKASGAPVVFNQTIERKIEGRTLH